MILEEERILSRPGGSFSMVLPKQWVEENLRQNQSGDYKVLLKVNGKVITIVPTSWQYRVPLGQGKPAAHSAMEIIAQHLQDDPERTMAIIQKEEPVTHMINKTEDSPIAPHDQPIGEQ